MKELNPDEVKAHYMQHGVVKTCAHFHIGTNRLYRIVGLPTLRRPWLDPNIFRRDLKRFKNNVQLLSKYYGLTESRIYAIMRGLKLKTTKTVWSVKDQNYLRMHYLMESKATLEKKLKRSWKAIRAHAALMGLTRKRALGYIQADVIRDLGVPEGTLRRWMDTHGFPHTKHGKNDYSFSEADIFDWLASGHALRIRRPENVAIQYREIWKDIHTRFVSREELFSYGFDTHHKTNRAFLTQHQIHVANGEGCYYPRDVMFEYLLPRAPRLYKPRPGQDWLQSIHDAYLTRYIPTETIHAVFNTVSMAYYYQIGFPRPICTGSYDRAAVIAWCEASPRRRKFIERLGHGE